MGEYRVQSNRYFFGEYEDDGLFGTHAYLYEPEYTDELRERDERAARERQLAEEARTQPRTSRNWWCTCRRCKIMPTEEECLCCREWDLLTGDTPDTGCVVSTKMFSALTNKAVLDTFFHMPKVNGSPRPVPEGPDGKLSADQHRFMAYRVFLESRLQGEPLGSDRRVLPSCVVEAIRKKYPSPSGTYDRVQEAEEISRIM